MNRFHVYPQPWVQFLVLAGMMNITFLASLPNARAIHPTVQMVLPQTLYDGIDYLLKYHQQMVIRSVKLFFSLANGH